MAAQDYSRHAAPALGAELEDLYAGYAEAIDDDQLESWPEFFADQCLYKIVSRENFERKLPLSLMLCDSKGALHDRVVAIRQTLMFIPRAVRHLLSGIRIKSELEGLLHTTASYAVFQTLNDDETRILSVGRYLDVLVRESGRLKFKEKVCVYDTVLVPNSVVYPL